VYRITGTIPVNNMIIQYIETALAHARYDVIADEEPYYGEVPELPGVWATGKTLEECRRNLMGVIDGWIIVRLRRGLPIPPIDNCTIEELTRMETGVNA
jgi:predicted RNase H-like HicB family nuclease